MMKYSVVVQFIRDHHTAKNKLKPDELRSAKYILNGNVTGAQVHGTYWKKEIEFQE